MKRALLIAVLTALAASLPALPAHGATKVQSFRAQMYLGPTQPDGGVVELEVRFKNSKQASRRFTPRRVTRVAFESVPLACANGPGDAASQLLLTRSVRTEIGVSPAGPPHTPKPKPGRYAFVFGGAIEELGGTTISGKIDKPTERKRGTPPRAHGRFTISGFDSGPGFTDCASNGTRSWSATRPQS